MYNTQSKNKNYLFELLENYNNREYVNTNNENITIEHIFPQNPSSEWSTQLSQDDYFSLKEKNLNTIANLTLSGNNGALGNKDFQSKKHMNNDGLEQGYAYSRLWLNNYLKSLEEWNMKTYDTRFEMIYDRFLNIWQIPDVVVSLENTEEDEQNIFDAEEPKHKKLEYFIFDNTKVETEIIAQMYFYVIRSLYEKNSQLLLNHPDIFKITRKTSDFRAAQEVINGWFIESNIDSNTKFATLKRLLSLFEMEEELLIKYKDNEAIANNSNRHSIRVVYWQRILQKIENTSLFKNVSPSKGHWLSTGAGTAGVSYTMLVTKSYASIELTISSSSKEQNKMYFNKLLKNKSQIEELLGQELIWEELPDNKMSRIHFMLKDVNLFDESNWDRMDQFFVENLPKFEKAFAESLRKLK